MKILVFLVLSSFMVGALSSGSAYVSSPYVGSYYSSPYAYPYSYLPLKGYYYATPPAMAAAPAVVAPAAPVVAPAAPVVAPAAPAAVASTVRYSNLVVANTGPAAYSYPASYTYPYGYSYAFGYPGYGYYK